MSAAAPPSSPPPPSSLSPLTGGRLGGSDDDSENGKKDSKRRRRGCPSTVSLAPVCPPPSLVDPGTDSTRPYYLFPLFLLVNIATMTDRSIIAGATKEFSAFVSGASDAPALVRENPDAGIGLLQASFIFGYSVAILLSGHYVHKIRWKPLVTCGMCVWWLGVLGSGNARRYDSFYVLLFSRMATGCSEAAFQVVAPPLIQDRGGRHTGLWLSVYLTGLPLGLAFGYVYGSRMAGSERWGWDWAFYFMCVGSSPLIVALMFVRDGINGGILGGTGERVDVVEDAPTDADDGGVEPLLASADGADDPTPRLRQKKFTLFSEIKACLTSPVLVTLSLGWAAIIGVVASLGTFGGAYVLALQLYDDEREAAYWFGIAAALAGVLGTPLGGRLADKVLDRYGVGRAGGEGEDGGGAARGEGVAEELRFPVVASLCARINALVAASLLFVWPTLAMQDAAFFLTFLFAGWTLLFMTQTGVNLVAMLSVDRCHRPNALAFLMLTSHLLGDVPLPIVLGLLKDKFAPACRVGPSGEFVDPETCKDQEDGVRKSLAIAYAWVFWSLIFFECARRYARREIAAAREREANALLFREENGNEVGESSFQYYHSQFKPPESARPPLTPTEGEAQQENNNIL
ncbi:hypothetical protein ACHAWF_017634 [Thalassiosira exigua]